MRQVQSEYIFDIWEFERLKRKRHKNKIFI